MSWLVPRPMEPRGSMELEQLDRRAFLRGMMVTSAGLLVPKPVQVFVPRPTREMMEFVKRVLANQLSGAAAAAYHDLLYQLEGSRVYSGRLRLG